MMKEVRLELKNAYSFLAVTMWLMTGILSGCSDYIDDVQKISISLDIENKDARRFVETINSQPEQLAVFNSLMEKFQPVYRSVALRQSSEYGMYYFIPYWDGELGQVGGALYYPVTYDMDTNGHVLLKNTLLSPKVVDAHVLNNEIPITQRFLYSHAFACLAEDGLKIDSELLNYEFLRDTVMAIDEKDIPSTRASIGYQFQGYISDGRYLEIRTRLSTQYIGGKTDAIYGVSNDRLAKWIADTFNYFRVPPQKCIVDLNWGELTLVIPLRCVPLDMCATYYNFVTSLLHVLEWTGYVDGFRMNFQYTYKVCEQGHVIDDIVGYHEGGYMTGGSTSEYSSNRNKDNGKGKGYTKFEEDCSAIEHAEHIKWEFKTMIDSLYQAKPYTYHKSHYRSFEYFRDAITKQRNVEFGISVEDYDGITTISDVQTNNDDSSVSIKVGRYTLFTVHNHPNQTPPSPLDLYSVCNNAADERIGPNYKGNVIYTDSDSIFYGILITDREKASRMRDSLESEIGIGHDFISGKKCDNILEAHKNTYANMELKERMMARLAIIAKYFDGGIRIVRWRKKENSTTVYDIDIRNEYKPIKCE